MAKLTLPRPVSTGDRNADSASRGAQQLHQSLTQVPFLDGNLGVVNGSTAIEFSASVDVWVEHRLGREPRGFFPVFLQESGSWVSLARLPDDGGKSHPLDRFIHVIANTNCVVSLWVF